MKLLWLIGGFTSLGIGLVGIILPLVPTVPLVLLATFCFARSSERLHYWLLTHKRFGPAINDWSQRGAISLRGKRLATVSIAVVFSISLLLGLPAYLLGIQAVTLGLVLVFIWSRPST